MMAAIKNGDLDGVIERLGNVLETVTVPDHPEIAEIKEIMVENGACGSLMSGSGPTVYTRTGNWQKRPVRPSGKRTADV